MTRASTETLLSLDRYAKIMGINPVHFSGATANRFFPLRNSCSDLWLQQQWFYADSVSREELAQEIHHAEDDLSRELGWYIAPVWTYQEARQFPRHYRKDVISRWGRDIRAYRVSVKAEWGKVIAGGRRATTEVELATVVTYTDEDGDGFAETATIAVATTETDISELHVYTAGKSANATWEIRPERSKTLSAGTATFTFWSWQLIDPDLWESFPTTDNIDSGPTTIDLRGLEDTPPTTTNLVATVDVYRIYNDTTQTSAQFLWRPKPKSTVFTCAGFCNTSGGTCTGCAYTVQNGCCIASDPQLGILTPAPATYSSSTDTWTQGCFTECRDPDIVKLWYYSGDIDNGYLAGRNYDPLSDDWARTIAYMATARLERPSCSCGNLTALYKKLQDDMALISGDARQYNVSPGDLDNPFGTRYGEVLAWRRIKREDNIIRRGGAV